VRRLFVLSLLVTSACQRKAPTPSCEAMASHVQDMMSPLDDLARGVRAVFAKRCTEDAWPDEVRSCIGETESTSEPRNCKQKLGPEQIKKLDADLEQVQRREAAKQVPPVCARYEGVLAKFTACDKVAPELRASVAARFKEAKAGWAAMPDKSELGGVCSSGIRLLKQAGADCPGSDQW